MASLSSTHLYGRSFVCTVGVPGGTPLKAAFDETATGIDVSGFDISFEVERTLKPEPNTCSVSIYNLSVDTRKKMSGVPKLTCKVEAGYQGNLSLLYLGEVRAAWTEREGTDFLTHVESGDSEKEIAQGRLTACLGPKVPLSTAIPAIVDALKIGQGNVAQITAALAKKNVTSINGSALTGNAANRMTDICRSAGLEWSVQNGAIQILDIGGTLNGSKAIQISASTGMINSPTVDSQGIVSASTLIIPGLMPGVLVNFDSLFVKGGYRVQRCKWHGETYGNDWQCDFECKKY